MKVLWLANIPSPYSVDFFNELGKMCNLTVLFERKQAADRDKSWGVFAFKMFRGIILKGIKYSEDKAFCPSVLKYLGKKYDIIVVSNMATLTGILAITYMRINNIAYLIQGDGGLKKDGHGFKEKIKTFLISGAKKCLSTGKAHDEYYLQYGAVKDKIKRIPFTSLYEADIYSSCADEEEKKSTRGQLNIKGKYVVLAIGQFIKRKGFDILIKAAKDLEPDVSIYILGGKCTEEYKTIIDEYEIKNVFFRDFVPHNELHKFFRAADMFVLPTREDIWGLVINEAMAHGLPIVTTKTCVAGLELVENGVNGYIVDVDNVLAVKDAINCVLQSDLKQMGTKSIERIKEYTFENTAKEHFLIFNNVM